MLTLRRIIVVLLGIFAVAVAFMAVSVALTGRLSLQDLRDAHTLPNSTFMQIEGVEIHVVEEGAGPLVVLVHGHMNSSRLWDAWAANLRDDYRVVRFDMPWYGLSSDGRHRGAGILDTYAVLDKLMQRYGDSRAVLVGTANGGPPLAWYARLRPDRVGALVLINTPFDPPVDVQGTAPVQSFMENEIFRVYGRPPWATRWFLAFLVRDPASRTTGLVDQTYDFSRRVGLRNVLTEYGTSTVFPDRDLNPQALTSMQALASLSVPVLIQWSENGYLRLSEGKKLHEQVRSSELRTFAEAGHWLPADQPQATVADFRRFIKEHDPFSAVEPSAENSESRAAGE